MFSKTKTLKSTENYSEQLDRLTSVIQDADAVVIGAGAGLSTSAGISYSGERFNDNFAEFIDKYHFHDMYSATFYPYESLEEYWAYISRHIFINRYEPQAGKPYTDLLEIVKDKDYFVITTNVDHQFQKAGTEKKRLFYTQGDYGLWQCSEPCQEKTYDNEDAVMQMVKEQKDLRIPSKLIPHCPKCKKPMSMNLRCDNTFVQDDGWHMAASRYTDFVQRNQGSKVLYLELGVGNNTPGIIKYPFWQMTAKNKNATYACINLDAAVAPHDIKQQSICIHGDIAEVIKDLRITLAMELN